MKKPMSRTTRWKWSGYVAVLLYALCGLALLLMPDLAADILGYALAAALCLIGLYNIIAYFRGDMMQSIMGFSFSSGLAALAIGVALLFMPRLLASLYVFVFGATLVVGGFAKVQMALDMGRMKARFWWCMLLAAAVSLVLGVVIMAQPRDATNAIVMFVGIAMLAEAIIDLLSLIMLHRRIRATNKLTNAALQAAQASVTVQPEPVPPVEVVAPIPEPAPPADTPQ